MLEDIRGHKGVVRRYSLVCQPERKDNPRALLFTTYNSVYIVLLEFSLTVKAATLIFISGLCLAISSPKEGKSGFIHNLVKI